ncbi:MAG TPA: NAD(+)/NADH kinase [Bacteroidota bacterium]|nr:NAD(+)/NADH kinase [Bacteroidota bacterium]
MKFGVIGNTAKPGIIEITKNLYSYLRSKGQTVIFHEQLGRWLKSIGGLPTNDESIICAESEFSEKAEMIIALGGDGTILSAARIINERGVPILGVNLGKLGFLAEFSVNEIEQCIDDVLTGRYYVEERMVLRSQSNIDEKTYYALNEIVVDKGASARVIDLETYVNDDYLVTYSADGIILTTPTGSTAYSLASGGPIVIPQSAVITINPIAPHTLTARPVIVPDDSIIKVVVKIKSKDVHISADGQVEGFYKTPAEFTIKKAPYTIKLVKRKQRTYYDLLRAKLMWGRDVRIGSNT